MQIIQWIGEVRLMTYEFDFELITYFTFLQGRGRVAALI